MNLKYHAFRAINSCDSLINFVNLSYKENYTYDNLLGSRKVGNLKLKLSNVTSMSELMFLAGKGFKGIEKS